MSYFTNIVPKYDYKYFDKFNQLQTKQLNIFQCFIRRIFGCYAETHLTNVAKKAYQLTLCYPVFKDGKKVIELIAKTKGVCGSSQPFIGFFSRSVLSGKKLDINVKYDIRKAEDSSDYKISSIGFKFIFTEESQVKAAEISIFKNKFESIVVHVQPNKHDLDTQQIHIVNTLIAKILTDSSAMSDVVFYANGKGVNSMQKKEFGKFGWKRAYSDEFSEEINGVKTSVEKTMYRFNKAEVEKNPDSDLFPCLSTDFAASFLEVQERTY